MQEDQKSSSKSMVTIGTHNGVFHTDDVFAVATLFLLLGDSVSKKIIRTRDESMLKSCDYVVDVGSVYNPAINRFDHHQGNIIPRPNGIPYASFGLVWKQFGAEVCGNNTTIAEKIEERLVYDIDADDNGIFTYQNKFPDIAPYTLVDYIDHRNSTWQEDFSLQDKLFESLVYFAKDILEREIKRSTDELTARSIVQGIYDSTTDKRVLVFDKSYPIGDLLEHMPEVLFIIKPDTVNGQWTASSPSKQKGVFENRAYFPESWAALRGKNLEDVTGIAGSIFCHKGRFFCVGDTKETVEEMVDKALQNIKT